MIKIGFLKTTISSAHQESPPGLCCSLFWSPSDNLDLNVSDILFPPFFVDIDQTGQFQTRSRQFLVHCASPPHDVTGRLAVWKQKVFAGVCKEIAFLVVALWALFIEAASSGSLLVIP